MRAAWYDRPGEAKDVLRVAELPDPVPGPAEMRIRIPASGINPGDTQKAIRRLRAGHGVPPHHSSQRRCGCGGSSRSAGTAEPDRATRLVLRRATLQAFRHCSRVRGGSGRPRRRAAGGVSFAQGACLGIPGITAHRAVHVAGPIESKTVMVQGAGGAVGLCAVQLARFAGAHVIGTVRSTDEEKTARDAGAHEVIMSDHDLVSAVKAIVHNGVDHIVEVAFAANIESDIALFKLGGSLATYASNHDKATAPF